MIEANLGRMCNVIQSFKIDQNRISASRLKPIHENIGPQNHNMYCGPVWNLVNHIVEGVIDPNKKGEVQ